MVSYADSKLRIVLLGKPGSGKSATGNTLLDRDVFTVSSSSSSVTKRCETQEAEVEDKVIAVVDTPGLFDTSMTDEELKSEMKKCMEMSAPGPHVFLLVIRLDVRFTEEENTVTWIQENLGEKAMLYTMILFTHKDQTDLPVKECIEKSRELKKMVNECKAGYHSFNNKDKNDGTQVTELIEKINRLVRENRGEHYTNDMYQEAQRTIIEEKRIKQQCEKYMKPTEEKVKQMQENMKEKDEHIKQVEKKIKRLEKNMNQRETAGRRGSMAPPLSNLRIVLLGKSGSGKSSAGNTILNKDAFETDESMDSVTKSCQKQNADVGGRIISVIDTPGLFDISVTQEELKSEIEKCVDMSAPGPHAFLLVIRLDVKYTEEEKNAEKWIQKNFGQDAVKHTIILFTHADALEGKDLHEYVRKSKAVQMLILQYEGRYHAFSNNKRENRDQVTVLLNMIDELLEENREECYTNEMYKEAQKKIKWENLKQRRKNDRKTALTAIGGAAFGGAAATGGAATGGAATGGAATGGAATGGAATGGVFSSQTSQFSTVAVGAAVLFGGAALIWAASHK